MRSNVTFDPKNWYWLADDKRIWSSKTGGLVQASDADYKAWAETGGIATQWPRDEAGAQTQAGLDVVLAYYGAPKVQDVSSAQAKIALSRAGFLPAVKASVDAIGGEVEIWFTDARVWQRNNPHVVEIGAGMNLSPAEIDALFHEAAKIDA